MISTKEIGGVTWYYRDNTNDLGIIDQVFTHNACHVPDNLSGKLFVDIGAHIGGVSVLAASRGAKVMAYEPRFDNYELLNLNIGALDIEIFCAGIGSPGIRQLYTGGYNTGQNSAFLIFPELNEAIFEYMKVISLQEALGNKVVDFMKIDCEGGEVEILPQVLEIPEQINQMQVEFHLPERNIIQDLAKLYDVKRLSNDSYMFAKL